MDLTLYREKLGTMKDEGRTLNLGTSNEERRTLNEKIGLRFRGTQDIIDAAEEGLLPDRIMITVHPQRWSDSFWAWTKELVWQNVKNAVKWGVVKVRSK